jgi:hypothetical protein
VLQVAGLKALSLPASMQPFEYAHNVQEMLREATHVLYCCRADEDVNHSWGGYVENLASSQDKPFAVVGCVS